MSDKPTSREPNLPSAGLNIKAVAERTGVPLHTLRAWERRYGIPRPERNAGNRYRVYDEQDIADVLQIKRHVQAGVSPAQASALLRQRASQGLSEAPAAGLPIEALRNTLHDAFVQRDETVAHHILNEAWSVFAPEQVIRDVLQPMMRQLGTEWQQNILSVEQEHFASNLVRQRMDALIHTQPMLPVTAPRLVAACAPEEQHDLGLLMLTLLAKRQGWNVTYLGQRTPLLDLRGAAQGARYIVLSVSTVIGLASLVPLWDQPPMPAPILVGGGLANDLPSLREHLPGAFLGQDGVAAMRTLATSAPRVSEWRPSSRLVNAARTLDAARLELVATVVTDYLGKADWTGNIDSRQENGKAEFRQQMTQSGMFLTDALVAALAFDTPELMDAQGAWLYCLTTPRNVPPHELERFVTSFATHSRKHLPTETAKLVNVLVQRFAASLKVQEQETK